jgi:hypothetical protein
LLPSIDDGEEAVTAEKIDGSKDDQEKVRTAILIVTY